MIRAFYFAEKQGDLVHLSHSFSPEPLILDVDMITYNTNLHSVCRTIDYSKYEIL